MKRFIKVIQGVSVLALVTLPLYLANEGELGVNLTTILSTATPTTLLIVTGVYDLFRVVVPAKTVLNFMGLLKKKLGDENYEQAKSLINNISPELVASTIAKVLNDLNQLKEDVASIKEKQDNAING